MKQGETIGRRGTPVISHWRMRLKWEKFGDAWECLGTDGDPGFDNGVIFVPAVLQLVYFVYDDWHCVDPEWVCQLAYVIQPEAQGKEQVEKAAIVYERARFNFPKSLTPVI